MASWFKQLSYLCHSDECYASLLENVTLTYETASSSGEESRAFIGMENDFTDYSSYTGWVAGTESFPWFQVTKHISVKNSNIQVISAFKSFIKTCILMQLLHSHVRQVPFMPAIVLQ